MLPFAFSLLCFVLHIHRASDRHTCCSIRESVVHVQSETAHISRAGVKPWWNPVILIRLSDMISMSCCFRCPRFQVLRQHQHLGCCVLTTNCFLVELYDSVDNGLALRDALKVSSKVFRPANVFPCLTAVLTTPFSCWTVLWFFSLWDSGYLSWFGDDNHERCRLQAFASCPTNPWKFELLQIVMWTCYSQNCVRFVHEFG